MLSQENSDVRVLLTCHEPPENLPSDHRLIVKCVDSPVPGTREEMMHDKYGKIRAGLIYARQFAPMWLMKADADDLVSKRLAKFVEGSHSAGAWYCETGWVNGYGSKWLMKLHNFHAVCGTSCVSYVTQADLPKSPHEDPSQFYLLTKGHHLVVDYLKTLPIPIYPLPFAAAVYTTDSGENWSGYWSSTMRSKRWLMRRLMNSRYLTQSKRREFGFDL